VHLDLEVVIGDAAGQGDDACPPIRPEPLDGSRDVHTVGS
jgi:hypothetical protein